MIVGQYNWYKRPQSAKKFGKVKKSRFLEYFLKPDYPQKSACMAFISENMSSRALHWAWDCSQTTLLDVETHFDTQIVFRDHKEVILVAKSSENLSNADFLGKSTEMWCQDVKSPFTFSITRFLKLLSVASVSRSAPRRMVKVWELQNRIDCEWTGCER